MDFEITEEQRMFRDMARKFAEQEILPSLKENERQEIFDPAIIKKMAAQGLLAPHMPQEYGGLGLDYVTSALIWESLCSASLAVTQAAVSGPIQPGTNLLDAGSEAQKEKYLSPVNKGEIILAGAVVEPNAGSDSSMIETTAVRSGNHWIINGTKIFITNGDIADVVLFIAQTDKSLGLKGLATFIVDKGTHGFSSTAQKGKISWRGGSEGTLRFTDMELPLENQIGETGKAMRNAMRGIDTGTAVPRRRCRRTLSELPGVMPQVCQGTRAVRKTHRGAPAYPRDFSRHGHKNRGVQMADLFCRLSQNPR